MKTGKFITYSAGVPRWPDEYISYYVDFNYVAPRLKEFYDIFKEAFEEDEFYDIEGNDNYAFALLQDIRQSHDYRQMLSFEKQIQSLLLHYPVVRLQAISLLIYRMKRTFNVKGMNRVRNQEQEEYIMYMEGSKEKMKNFWLLGSRYREVMGLTKRQASALDKVLHRYNHFNSIEFCLVETIKFFCATLDELNKLFQKKKTTIEEVFTDFSESLSKKRKSLFPYINASAEDIWMLMEIELYTLLFDHCENRVRSTYKYGYHLQVYPTFNMVTVLQSYDKLLASKYDAIFDTLVVTIAPPDAAAISELSRQSPFYLKSQLKELVKTYKQSPEDCIRRIIKLGEINHKNPMVKEFYYAAFSFAAGKDKRAALSFYLYFTWHDLYISRPEYLSLDPKQQAKLFKNEDESEAFTTILTGLRQNNNINEAFHALENMFTPKRRKIELDSEAIETIRHQHVDTVDVLTRYLEEDAANLDATPADKNNKAKQRAQSPPSSLYLTSLKLNPLQEELLAFFSTKRFAVTSSELEEFCRKRSVFPGQLVESINAACFDLLDDLLIEQDDQQYKIETQYYNMILQ